MSHEYDFVILVGIACAEILGMYNIQLCNIISVDMLQTGITGDLSQSRSQSQRIATEFCTTGISHVLTLAGDGKTGEQGEEIGYRTTDESDNEYHQ